MSAHAEPCARLARYPRRCADVATGAMIREMPPRMHMFVVIDICARYARRVPRAAVPYAVCHATSITCRERCFAYYVFAVVYAAFSARATMPRVIRRNDTRYARHDATMLSCAIAAMPPAYAALMRFFDESAPR